MTVHYYGIENCAFNYLEGRAIIVAPPDSVPDILMQAGFEQLPDGRWVHVLTSDELRFINNSSDPAIFGIPPDSHIQSDRLIILSQICYYCGGLAAPLVLLHFKVPFVYVLMPFLGFMTTGLVLLIVARVRYPSCKTDKKLRHYLVTLVGVLLVLAACDRCIQGCNNTFQACGGCTQEKSESSTQP